MAAPVSGTQVSPDRRRDPNAINLDDYKGQIDPCQFCKPEEVLLGRACNWCMSQGYLAVCTNCNGTGKHTGASAWDGGRSSHTSTCTPCGGKGYFPAREADYRRQQMLRPVISSASTSASMPSATRPLPPVVQPMPNLGISRKPK